MTTIPTEVARRRPADLVPAATANRPTAPDRAERLVMRLLAGLFLAFAGFQMWCAATGYHI